MGQSTSPNDPAFFLVHCNVDRVWAAWQGRFPGAPYLPPQIASADLLFHRIDDPLHTFFGDPWRLTVRQTLASSVWYTYDTTADLDRLVA